MCTNCLSRANQTSALNEPALVILALHPLALWIAIAVVWTGLICGHNTNLWIRANQWHVLYYFLHSA